MYLLSRRELSFITIFQNFRVETLWVEVRSRNGKDEIVSFIYVPSGKGGDLDFVGLRKIAPVFLLYPVSSDLFVLGTGTEKGGFRTVVSEEELLTLIDEDWNTEVVKEFLTQKPTFLFRKGKEVFPKTYDQLRAKRMYSVLHRKAKRDAYMFDVDVALLKAGDRDFVSLLEYKHDKGDRLSYNERIGYAFLSQNYPVLLVRGTDSFTVSRIKGWEEEFLGKATRETLEDFIEEVLACGKST